MSKPEQKTAINVVLGAMTFGAEGKHGTRVHDVKDVAEIIDVFQAHGHYEIDTSRVYGEGTSEEYLTKIDWKKRGLIIDTKIYPVPQYGIFHNEESIRKQLQASLNALKTDSVDMWYLHAPDRATPYEVTLKAINDLYKEGKFRRFGISNYMSWEVAQIMEICKANNYVKPVAYQGIYNAIHRTVEPELFPCLRKYGLAFYEFNPLGGGFFTGRYRSLQDSVEPGSRFDDSNYQGKAYRKRYWNEPHFKALAKIEAVAKKHNLTLAEIALRWISHHSQLKREHGDAILIGASSVKHIKQNLEDLEKGPLPEEVLTVLDDAWFDVSPYAAKYWH